MYWCNKCGEFVDGREKVVEIYHSEVRACETWNTIKCERCGEDVEDVGACENCGESINPRERLCDCCKEDYTIQIIKAVEHISRTPYKKIPDEERENILDNITYMGSELSWQIYERRKNKK